MGFIMWKIITLNSFLFVYMNSLFAGILIEKGEYKLTSFVEYGKEKSFFRLNQDTRSQCILEFLTSQSLHTTQSGYYDAVILVDKDIRPCNLNSVVIKEIKPHVFKQRPLEQEIDGHEYRIPTSWHNNLRPEYDY